MKVLKYGLLLTSIAVLTSCYEDKGNYQYDESIQDISVKLESLYGIRKQDQKMSFTITPEITTKDGDKSHLRYVWVMNTQTPNSSANDTIGTDEAVTLELDPTAEDFAYKYYLRLYVTDTQTQGVTMVPTQVEVTKPYSYAWAVLHETDNHAELGAVEYVGNEMMVTPNAFSKDKGETLKGKPISLAVTQHETTKSYWTYEAPSQFYINTTVPEESGLYNQSEKFKLMASWNNLVAEQQKGDIDFAQMQTAACPNSGLVVYSKGHAFNSCYYSPYLFEMAAASNLPGDFYIDKVAAGPHTAIAYDTKGHRFVHLALQSSGTWIGFNPTEIGEAAPVTRINYRQGEDAADANSIDPNEQVIRMFNGYHYERSGTAIWQRYGGYAYALAPGKQSHVYVFRYYALTHSDVPAIPYSYKFVTPEGVDENTPMTSGPNYNNIIFYATGNKVYRLDVSTGQTSLIYQYEDTGAKISCLKMAVDGYAFGDSDDTLGTDTYGHPYSRTLGIGINTSDGKGVLVVLQLNTAGKIDTDHKYPSTQVHQGFGPITDIAFI